nr:DUF6792 domain-containing protein [Bacillus weihaiensis]
MSNEELLNTDILRARIMNLEYKNLSEDKIKSEIRRIYFAETRKELKSDLTIYRSDVILKELSEHSIDSGFDFIAKNRKLTSPSQLQERGCELGEKDTWRPIEWSYNLVGIYVGGTYNQFQDAKEFDNKVHIIISK